jgi:hypothetical protein
MPDVLEFLCYAVAFVSFVFAAFGPSQASRITTRVNLIGFGLAWWVLVPLWKAWPF